MADRKKKRNNIDKAQANQILQNVFQACNQQPNHVTVDQLLERKKAMVHPYNVWIVVSIVALVLTFLSPLALNPMSNRIKKGEPETNITITNHQVTDGHFQMTLSGDFIDYSSIHAPNSAGKKIYPDSYSAADGTVSIPYDGKEELNIYVSDYNGKQLHLLLSPKE